jgi:hypothetical protein
MDLLRRRFSSSSSLAAVLLGAVAFTVTGCGFDASQSASVSSSANIAGILHGGPNPVVGATVTLYATQSNGYGGAGLQLAQTTSNSAGGFAFNASSYTCPAGQQAYITAAAGNTGGNTANANALLMAAIGPCSSLGSSTSIWIDEPTTIAAAYALSNFITISGSGATAVVGVSAPAKNNAATGSCTGTGSSMTCQTAGLAHAFLNAANLVNASNIGGFGTSQPTGQVYASPPSNPTTSSTAVALQNLVPLQLINSLGNSIQACVNSNGGVAGDSTACGTLFTNTTVPSTYSSNVTFTTAPANTLQALVNLAKFPFMSSAAVTRIYNLAQASVFYLPALTAAPPDYSIAILFRSYGSGANQIGTVYYTTTDINDNVYATALTAPSTGSILGAVPYIAHSLSSDGAGNWTTPASLLPTTSAIYTCDAWGGSAATSGACFAAPDTAGHLWVGMGANGLSAGGLWQVSTASGAVTQFTAVNGTSTYPFALALDRNNNLFYSGTLNGSNNLFEIPSGAAATATPTAVSVGGAAFAGGHLSSSIVFDTAGNIFAPLASGSNVGFSYIANTGTLSAEAFATAANQCNCLGGTVNKWPTGGMIDASGNYWLTTQNALTKIAAGATNAQGVTGGGSTGVNSFALGSATTTTLRISSIDGASTIFVPDNDTSGSVNEQAGSPTAPAPALDIYYTTLATPALATIQSCNTGAATGNATCITGNATAPNSGIFYQAVNPAIDSTGSMWVSSEGNDAVIQVIGTAAPTWPQASYLHPGVMPQ